MKWVEKYPGGGGERKAISVGQVKKSACCFVTFALSLCLLLLARYFMYTIDQVSSCVTIL